MDKVQRTMCNLHCGAGKVLLLCNAKSYEGPHYIPSGILYSHQHLLSSKTNCASVFLVFMLTLKEVDIPCAVF